MTKIKDVARQAGVSVATVSRTLSGHPYVSAGTRERVLQAIKHLDYRPDQVARSLRRRRTNLIGLVVSTIENSFFTEVAHAAEQAAHERDYNLIVCNTDENPEQEKVYLQVLDQQLVTGIILAPAPGVEPHLISFVAKELPIVLINRRLHHLPFSSITSDDREAAFQCVNYLIEQGRQRIAAIIGLPATFTTQERLAGYRRALASAGLPQEPLYVVEGKANLHGGYAAARHLMQQEKPPDALFAFNNLMVQGAVMALQDLGLTWPDVVDVAGFGAFTTAHLYRPPLTLIEQPTHAMGRRAVNMLLDQLEEQGHNSPEHVVLQNRLIAREEWASRHASNLHSLSIIDPYRYQEVVD
jgi:DNA-binding LacI/PurR family transcriptional regulator